MEQLKKRKKKILLILGIWAAVGLAPFLFYMGTFSKTEATGRIGEEKAKQIALEHAGLSKEEVRFIRAEEDDENGIFVYEIEFYKGTKEYDYTIDAKSGRLISFDSEIEGYQNTNEDTKIIDLQEAEKIALKHVKLKAEDVHMIRASLSKDFKNPVYDIEFYSGEMEYDFEIDAETGMILDFDKDVESFRFPNESPKDPNFPADDRSVPKEPASPSKQRGKTKSSVQSQNGSQEKLLSLEEAQQIALEDLNMNDANPVFTKSYLDKDDARINYEFEIRVGVTEYEYEIDAITGEILSFDRE